MKTEVRHLVVSAYFLGATDGCEALLERCRQRTGPDKWAIRSGLGYCLNRSGNWEYEPIPSNRSAEFLARCRYVTVEEALAAWDARREGPL